MYMWKVVLVGEFFLTLTIYFIYILQMKVYVVSNIVV